MPIAKLINKTEYLIGLWRITENLDTIKKLIINELDNNEVKICENFNSIKRKKQWLTTRLLLKILLGKYHKILYDKFSKPFLHNKKISISHSNEFVAIIISEHNCAIDIEKISEKAVRIKNKFLSIQEQKFCNSYQCYTTLWSLKETAYKFYGKKSISFANNIKINKLDNQTATVILHKEKILLSLQMKIIKFNSHILTYCVQ